MKDGKTSFEFEERKAHFAERRLNVLVIQLGQPGESVLGLTKALLQRFEHGGRLLPQGGLGPEGPKSVRISRETARPRAPPPSRVTGHALN